MVNDNYAILINTCDKFDDCWEPFFKLFTTYWPDCKGTIYLNTEHKSFKYPGLKIKCLKVADENTDKRLTWSECLIKALDSIDEDYVLYLQEDYFFNATVNNSLFHKTLELMQRNPEMECLHLRSRVGMGSVFLEEEELQLIERNNSVNYSASCQASIWKKEILLKLVEPSENGWDFEKFGSIRARVNQHKFYNLNLKTKEQKFIFSYILTGVVQGKWLDQEVKELFTKHSIDVDYSIRGFIQKEKRTFLGKLIFKFDELKYDIRAYFYLCKYYIKNKIAR